MSRKLFVNDPYEVCECVNGATNAITNTIFNKKFPIESEEETKKREEEERVINEQRNKLLNDLNHDYEVKKAIQIAKAFNAYLYKFIYCPNAKFYGKVVDININNNGNITDVYCIGFYTDPLIYSNTYLSNLLLNSHNINAYCADGDMQFISEETFHHEFEKYKKSLLNFIEKHADEVLFEDGCDMETYNLSSFAKKIQYLVKDGTLTEEELTKRVKEKFEPYFEEYMKGYRSFRMQKSNYKLDD